LAYDIFLDILSAITNANYGAAALTGLASAFDSDDLADLDKVATDAQWPAVGRYIFLNSAFDNALKKDDTMKLALNFGGTEVIRDGRIPNVFGFNYVTNPNIPANGENLAGFIAFKSALLIATAPIQPAEEVLRDGTQYTVMTDPDLGISLEARSFGSSQMDRAFRVIESNYGYAVGNASALKRIVTA
jgi:hypothetical protein